MLSVCEFYLFISLFSIILISIILCKFIMVVNNFLVLVQISFQVSMHLLINLITGT